MDGYGWWEGGVCGWVGRWIAYPDLSELVGGMSSLLRKLLVPELEFLRGLMVNI